MCRACAPERAHVWSSASATGRLCAQRAEHTFDHSAREGPLSRARAGSGMGEGLCSSLPSSFLFSSVSVAKRQRQSLAALAIRSSRANGAIRLSSRLPLPLSRGLLRETLLSGNPTARNSSRRAASLVSPSSVVVISIRLAVWTGTARSVPHPRALRCASRGVASHPRSLAAFRNITLSPS